MRGRAIRSTGRIVGGSRWLVGVMACSLAGCIATQPPRHPGAGPLPITRVVLYQSGVGYFERSGEVTEDTLRLQVQPDQINDLLKSLTVVGQGDTTVASVSLPLEQSGDRIVQQLPPQVRDVSGVLDVLRVFRGARVRLHAPGLGVLSGRVLGVENFQASSHDEPARAQWVVSLVTAGGEIKTVPVEHVESIELLNPSLAAGLERSLDVALGEGGWKSIELTIRWADKSSGRVTASYVVEMPRWKPAYRLVLQAGAEPLLQGWAVVDNVSGEDWRDVELSLVSGSPVSFRYDLHSPQYVHRVERSPVGADSALAPPPSEKPGYEQREDLALSDSEEREQEAAPQRVLRLKRRANTAAGAKASPPSSAAGPAPQHWADRLQLVGGAAEAEAVGPLFRYDIAERLTIEDRSSTLVNLVNQRVTGQQVAYFRPDLSPGAESIHPYRAVKWLNNTELMLEQGPITVYSEGTFVGEGLVQSMPPGATSFLTFALDPRISLREHEAVGEHSNRVVSISNGVMTSEVQNVRTQTFEVSSGGDQPVIAYIRTARQTGWTLDSPPEGTVQTAEAQILPLNVPAKSVARLQAVWKQAVRRTVALDSHQAEDLLRAYLATGQAPADLTGPVQQVLAIQRQIGQRKREKQQLEQAHRRLSQDQRRVRDNLNVLRKTQGNAALQKQLSEKLARQEKQLGRLSGQIVTIVEEIPDLQKQLADLIPAIHL